IKIITCIKNNIYIYNICIYYIYITIVGFVAGTNKTTGCTRLQTVADIPYVYIYILFNRASDDLFKTPGRTKVGAYQFT
uniref:Uncharacterized protein n=1 Tax=Ciona intestinalis TaxID=7719 RepID=H2XMT3_CIOIN